MGPTDHARLACENDGLYGWISSLLESSYDLQQNKTKKNKQRNILIPWFPKDNNVIIISRNIIYIILYCIY